MTFERSCLASILAASVLVSPGCGDDDDSGSNGGDAGPGGKGGSTAGSMSGGTGGSVMNPAGCPAQSPGDGAACTMLMLECAYGAMECTCERGFSTGNAWDCSTTGQGGQGGQGVPGGQMMCPATEPKNGDTCMPGRGDCMFGTKICDCPSDLNTWICWDPATDCPAMQPAERDACTLVGIECEYGQGDDCECGDMGWDCGGQFCPATAPTPMEACEGGDGMCSYGATNVCDCDSSVWVCWNPADCPATPPAEASACTTQGMLCEYGEGECECDDMAWECDDIDTDADGGV